MGDLKSKFRHTCEYRSLEHSKSLGEQRKGFLKVTLW